MKTFFSISLLTAAIFAWSHRGGDSNSCPDCFALPFDLTPMLQPPNPAYPSPPAVADWQTMDAAARQENAQQRIKPVLEKELAERKIPWGAPVFLRVFKESREMELWTQAEGEWTRLRSYNIAAMSGDLGPKMMEGDRQAPEGFYAVKASALNPLSKFHLSFDIGYPNDFDRAHGRTGTFIMVHGNEVSLGCFAMTDAKIEEIYLLVSAALEHGQTEVPVHVFPFRMDEARMAKELAANHPALPFWQDLHAGYDFFETRNQVPTVEVKEKRYLVQK